MTRLDEAAMFLAGGHALLPERKLRHTAPRTVIDLGCIAELRGIEILEDGALPEPAAPGGCGTHRRDDHIRRDRVLPRRRPRRTPAWEGQPR